MSETQPNMTFSTVEQYREYISKQTRAAKERNAQNGSFIGSQAPYGYKKSEQDHHQLSVDSCSALIVVDIFEQIRSSNSPKLVAERLNAKGIPTPAQYAYISANKTIPPFLADSKWEPKTIVNIIHNKVYLGHLEQGKRRNLAYNSSARMIVPENEWIVSNHKHTPLFTQSEWDDAQLALKKDQRIRKSSNDDSRLFAGILYCGECGQPLVSSVKRGKSGVEKRIYKCSTYNNGKGCTSHYVVEADLTAYVLRELNNQENNNAELTRSYVLNNFEKIVINETQIIDSKYQFFYRR